MKQTRDYPKELLSYIFVSPIIWLFKKIKGGIKNEK